MSLKETLKFEKDNMPDFQWKFEKFMLAYLAVGLGGAILAACACMSIGFTSGEDGGLWYIPIIVWGCVYIGMTIALVVKSKDIKTKLHRYHSDKLSEQFYDMDYSKARQQLLDDKKITEDGFVVLVESDKTETIPYDQAKIIFAPRFWGGKLFLNLLLLDAGNRVFAECMNNSYYNYLIRHTHLIQDVALFELFDKDKEKFTEMLLKYNNAAKIENKLKSTYL